MTRSPHHGQSEKESTEERYSGVRGELRLLADLCRDVAGFAREDMKRIAAILRGNVDPIGDWCQMKHCDRTPITEYPHPERYRSDIQVCRYHWIFLNAGIWGVRLIILLLLVAGGFVLLTEGSA